MKIYRFEWDENKNQANREKHGISFETARLVFDDAHCLLVLDRMIIRIISARRATNQEQNDYAESL